MKTYSLQSASIKVIIMITKMLGFVPQSNRLNYSTQASVSDGIPAHELQKEADRAASLPVPLLRQPAGVEIRF